MKDATPLTPSSAYMSGTPFSNVNNIQSMICDDQKAKIIVFTGKDA